MSKQKIVHIIAIQEKYLDQISQQMKNVLGPQIILRPITLKELRTNMVLPNDVVVLSHHMIRGLVSQLIPAECSCIIAKRDVNFANAKELISLPPGQQILVVNDTKNNIEEIVASLKETFFEHEYHPYNPDVPIPDSIDYILTPGELDFLPSEINKVINIGSRTLDIETFFEIANALGMDYHPNQIVKRYMKSLISLSLEFDEEINGHRLNQTKDIRNIARYTFQEVIAVSSTMKEIVHRAKEFARTPLPVYIYGEIGTGKSMLAQAIHHHSYYSAAPFITVNCKSTPTDMLENELFGSEDNQIITMGAFEIAKNGTVYLEEIDKLHVPLQKRILQAIKEKQFFRVGGNKPISFHTRLVSCSTEELKNIIDDGKMNNPFYDHLSSLSLKVPSLKERKDDFIPLIEDILRRIKKTEIRLSNEVMGSLLDYDWPGNVTELYNTITYLAFLGEQTIQIESLPIRIRKEESNFHSLRLQEVNSQEAIKKIESHGFLEESVEILKIFEAGKRERTSYGRLTLRKLLEEKGIFLTEQQLRMRMEILQQLDLLIVRQGRAGSTISRNGEEFLQFISSTYSHDFHS